MNEMTKAIDAQRLTLILHDLRLPAIKQVWPQFVERADKEAWPAARLLAALAEHEIAEPDRRRIERHLLEARLPSGKTIDAFAFKAVPMISKAQVLALCSGDGSIETGAITKLDKYHLIILDDLAYVTKDQAEPSVLFELILHQPAN